MSVWFVHLSGNEADLEELSKSVNSSELCVMQENNEFILKSADFNQLRSVEEVKNKANELLSLINGAVRLALGTRRNLTIDAVIKIKNDGSRITTRFLSDTVYVSSSTSYTIKRNNGSVEEFHPADPVLNWITIAKNNATIAQVLRLLERGDDWVNLYRLYEIIRQDVGGDENIASNGWATNRQIERFRRTANSVTALGVQARHGVETAEPPPNPMQWSEATVFIRTVIHNWLTSKQTTS